VKVLVAYDGTQGAKKALEYILKFREMIECLYVVYIFPRLIPSAVQVDSFSPHPVVEESSQISREILETAKKILDGVEIPCHFINEEAPGEGIARRIVALAEENGAELIVTGTRKLRGLTKVILGSVSTELIKISKFPVLVVPP